MSSSFRRRPIVVAPRVVTSPKVVAKPQAKAKPAPAQAPVWEAMSSVSFDTASHGISLPERPIRLVAIDLDGTLLTSKKQISERTASALASLPKQGIRVVIASARPPRSVRHIYKALGLDT